MSKSVSKFMVIKSELFFFMLMTQKYDDPLPDI